jgi:hypothetical protein
MDHIRATDTAFDRPGRATAAVEGIPKAAVWHRPVVQRLGVADATEGATNMNGGENSNSYDS